MNSILVMIHLGTNSGYAVGTLERVFYRMALQLVGHPDKIHFCYADLESGPPASLPDDFRNVVAFDSAGAEPAHLRYIEDYIRTHRIDTVFGFDQPVERPCYRFFRRAGVTTIISYFGAPTSSLNTGLWLLLKRIEVWLRRHRPNHFIFESEAMQLTAVQGRGIPRCDTSVVPLGIDTERYRPSDTPDYYAHDRFGIPRDREIIFYSGHIQERKGVRVLIQAAMDTVLRRGRKDMHFLLVGNRPAQEQPYRDLYEGTEAAQYITFGGYRDDVARILPGCYVGVIPSTGWDSFTMSSLEMASCGLPLVASRLQGLVEAVADRETGYLFEPGDYRGLADILEQLRADRVLRDSLSRAARARIVRTFSQEHQLENLLAVVRTVSSRRSPSPVAGMQPQTQRT